MAFNLNAWSNVSSAAIDGAKVWSYRTLVDNLATVRGSGYFNQIRFGVQENDLIYIACTDGVDQIRITSGNSVSPLTTTPFAAGSGAPSNATYITQTADGGLSNEQALAALTTGIMESTTGTGVVSINASLTSLSATPSAADKYAYSTALDTWTEGNIDATGRALVANGLVQYANLGSETLQTAFNAMIGMIDVFPSTDVTSDGATITLTYEKDGGGDVVAYFDGGPITIDCTPALTIALSAGTSAVPVKNYVYILKSAPTILTGNTTGFPTTVEFIPVGTYICQTAGIVQTFGTLASHSYSDDLWKDTTQNGMVHYLAAWIRTQPATWESGVALTPTLTALGPDTLTLALAVGVVLQLHEHTFPAFDTTGGGSTNLNTFFVVNDNAAAYTQGDDLYNFKSDSSGNAASNNNRISWVVWASISETTGDCKMFVNLPDGFYTTDADAIADAERFTNYAIPDEYKGAAFLIGKLTYQYQSGGGGSLTLVEQVDLRGSFPSTVAGGTGISGASVHLDNLTSVAINTSLISDTDVTYDLGTIAIRWQNIYAQSLGTGDTLGDKLFIRAYDTVGTSFSSFMTLTAGNPPTASLSGNVTGTTQAGGDNSTKLATTAYADASGGGATVALDNLAGVSINTSLISDTDITDDLGSLAVRWNNIYAQKLSSGDTVADVLTLSAYDVDGAATENFITLTSANVPTCVIASGVTATTQAAGEDSTKIATTAYADRVGLNSPVIGPASGGATSFYHTTIIGGANSTGTPVSGTIFFIPFQSCDTTWTRIGMNVTTLAVAKTIRLGIYEMDPTTGGPGDLVLDAGTISTTTTGEKEITISQALERRMYWLAYIGDSNGIVLSVNGTTANWAPMGLTTGGGSAAEITSLDKSSSSGEHTALSDPAVTTLAAVSNAPHRIW